MRLPKGTFVGAAKILGPLVLLMSVGWFLFPFFAEDLNVAVGDVTEVEEVDMARIKILSYSMTTLCALFGLVLLFAALLGKEADDTRLVS